MYKQNPTILSILFLLSLCCNSALATDKYVATGGNNSSIGTEEAPWKSIQHGVDSITGGDTLFIRAGTYSEKILFYGSEDSGSPPSSYVSLRNFPDEHVIIDGQLLSPVEREGLLSVINASFIHISGIEFINFRTSDNNHSPIGIYVEGSSHDIHITNNIIHNIEINATDGGAHGIAIYGTDGNSSIHDILIDANEIYDCLLGWSEALVLNGNVNNFLITNNSVHDCDNIAYDFIGFEGECSDCQLADPDNLDQARDGLVKGNIAYNIDTINNPAYGNERSAAGFYVDGGKDIIFEQNIAHHCNLGFELASEHLGKATENITVRNNIIYNNHIAGISTGGYELVRGSADNCTIVNNTFYKNSNSSRPEDDWGAEVLLQFNNLGNIYKNNILFSTPEGVRVELGGASNINNTFDFNLYYGSSLGEAPGVNSITADPLLTDPDSGDMHLLSLLSPAMNNGDNLSTTQIGTADHYGKYRIYDNIIDIGAHEFGSVGVPEKSGDVNNDNRVDLEDLLLAIQLLTGHSRLLNIESDTNNDGQIGLDDALFILQTVSNN